MITPTAQANILSIITSTACIFQMISKKSWGEKEGGLYLTKQDAARLQVQGDPMSLVVQEVFQSQELDSAHLPPVPPVNSNLQLS